MYLGQMETEVGPPGGDYGSEYWEKRGMAPPMTIEYGPPGGHMWKRLTSRGRRSKRLGQFGETSPVTMLLIGGALLWLAFKKK